MSRDHYIHNMHTSFCTTRLPDVEKVQGYLNQAMRSGKMSNFGILYNLFCQRLEEYFSLAGTGFRVVIASSGHSALMAAYAALKCTTLLVPGYTFVSTACAATLQGKSVIYNDVDPQTACLTPKLVLEAVRAGVVFDAVAVTAALSTIPDLHGLREVCDRLGKTLVFDAAATFGTQGIHTIADATCISLHATKTFPLGEGGIVICKEGLVPKVLQFLNFGLDPLTRLPSGPGINGKASEYTCAIGLALLEDIQEAIDRRIVNVDVLRMRFGSSFSRLVPWSSAGASTVYQALPVFPPSETQAQAVRALLSDQDVQILQYYPPLAKLPVATDLYKRNVCLPVHQNVGGTALLDMARAILAP